MTNFERHWNAAASRAHIEMEILAENPHIDRRILHNLVTSRFQKLQARERHQKAAGRQPKNRWKQSHFNGALAGEIQNYRRSH